ncbi:MAG: MCE family protein [Gemmatimonadetes bacterium]|nr:MCE family protein [Gemmatimonadota bacterium]
MATGVEAERKAAHGRLKEEDLLKALPRRSANREVRVGIFVLVGLAAFLTILFTMTDVGTFRGRYYANTVVESAGGMRRGDPVQMRGVNVGRVIDFDIVPEGVGVRLEIYDEYEIPADSRAQVKSNGLLGGMVVDIVPGRSAERMVDGATLPGVAEGTDIMAQAVGIGSRADTALMRVNRLLSDQTIGSVGSSAEELQALLDELNGIATQQRGQLSALSASLRRSATNVESATTGLELQRSIQQVDALTAQMAQTTAGLTRTSASLQAVIGRLERGEGTLGKLTSDEQLYNNLNATVNNLNALITDIQQNPRKYISVTVF